MVTDAEIYSLWTRTQNILEFSRALIALDRTKQKPVAWLLEHPEIGGDGFSLTGDRDQAKHWIARGGAATPLVPKLLDE